MIKGFKRFTRDRRYGNVFIALSFIGIGVMGSQLRELSARLPRVEVGATAPRFSAYSITQPARRVSSSDVHGSVYLLNVWATFCEPCRREMNSIERLYETYGKQGLRIIAVSVDPQSKKGLVADFVATSHLTFEVLHDPDGNALRSVGGLGIPTSVLVGRDGRVRARIVGERDWNSPEMRKLAERVLAE